MQDLRDGGSDVEVVIYAVAFIVRKSLYKRWPVSLTPVFHACNMDIWPSLFRYQRYLIEKLLENVGSSVARAELPSLAGIGDTISRSHN